MKTTGGFVMKFEEKRFCRVNTLADRWDCSTRRIYELVEKKVLHCFHPERQVGKKGMMLDVQRVLEVEREGMISDYAGEKFDT